MDILRQTIIDQNEAATGVSLRPRNVRINRQGHLHHGQAGYVDIVEGHESRVVIEDCVRSWQPSVCLVDMGEES